MPNKKINALDVRTAVATDLMLVGDPSTGTAYKSTLSTLPLVPYTGATGAVSLGLYGLTAGTLTLQEQALNSSTYKLTQRMASNDYWSIYGFASVADYGDLYFELQDNAAFADGQRFRFHYGNASSGTPKDILLMDYNTATFDGSVQVNTLAGTGTRMVVSDANGALSTQAIPSVSGYVPYTGATADVNLGVHRILAQNATIASSGSGDTATLNHTSGSGIGLNITKGGNGEGLYVNKTGGSGNAATIIGTLNATTLVKNGGTSAQILAADGSVITAGTNITISGGTISASGGGGGSMAIGGSITSATAGSVLFAGASGVLAQDNANFFWDDTNNRLGIGTNAPSAGIEYKSSGSDAWVRMSRGANNYHAGFTLNPAGTWSTINLLWSVGLAASTNNYQVWGWTGSSEIYYQRIFGNTGNTWIGATSTSPSDAGYRLDVNGTARVSGSTTFGTLGTGTGMFWDNTNNRLGIGTATPTESLEIRGTANSGTGFAVINTNAGSLAQAQCYTQSNAGYLFFGKRSTTYSAFKIIAPSDAFFYNTGADLAFYNENNRIKFAAGASATSQLTIFTTGNVGVGTNLTDAGYRLDVNGTARVSGDMVVNGVTFGRGNSNIINNVALGQDALRVITTGPYNVGIGFEALYNATTGNANIAIGYQTLRAATTGSSNLAIGYQSLLTNNGSDNVGIAAGTLRSNTTGGKNVSISPGSLFTNTTGSNNLAIGFNALNLNVSGSDNIAIGQQSLAKSTSNYNSAIGSISLFSNTTGASNTAIGYAAAYWATTGSNNVCVGQDAGASFGTSPGTAMPISNNSIYIGVSTRALADNQTNQIVIGYDATGAGSNSVTLGNTSITKTILRGTLNAANLPTSATGLGAGDIWNDAGTLKIV